MFRGEGLHIIPKGITVDADFRWLHLNRWIPQKDVRLLIYKRFSIIDWWVIIIAHFPHSNCSEMRPFYYCAYFGYRQLFDYFWQRGFTVCGDAALIGAIRGQQLEMCEYIYSRYYCRAPSLKPIISTGNIELVRWALNQRGVKIRSKDVWHAKEKGFNEIVKLLDW